MQLRCDLHRSDKHSYTLNDKKTENKPPEDEIRSRNRFSFTVAFLTDEMYSSCHHPQIIPVTYLFHAAENDTIRAADMD